MEWKSPYIIYRINAEKALQEVFWAEDIKKAKYWLTYIAEPGDVLCKTPIHPAHSHSKTAPEYWSHKESSGKPLTDEAAWRKFAKDKAGDVQFPVEQHTLPTE